MTCLHACCMERPLDQDDDERQDHIEEEGDEVYEGGQRACLLGA